MTQYEAIALVLAAIAVFVSWRTHVKQERLSKFDVNIKIGSSAILFPNLYKEINVCGIYLYITNKSTLPISITYITFEDYSTSPELYQNNCEQLNKLKPKITTMTAPLYLNSYEAQSGFFILHSRKENKIPEEKTYNIEMHTSRGVLNKSAKLSFNTLNIET